MCQDLCGCSVPLFPLNCYSSLQHPGDLHPIPLPPPWHRNRPGSRSVLSRSLTSLAQPVMLPFRRIRCSSNGHSGSGRICYCPQSYNKRKIAPSRRSGDHDGGRRNNTVFLSERRGERHNEDADVRIRYCGAGHGSNHMPFHGTC